MKNNLRNKVLFVLLLLLVLGNIMATIFLWTRYHRGERSAHPPRHEPRGAVLPELLEFDSARNSKFQALSEKHFALMDTLKSLEFLMREKLYSGIDAHSLDTSNMHQLAYDLALIQKKINEANVLHFSEVKKLCSPNQFDKLKSLIKASMMRDMGPAHFLEAMPEKTRDSIMKKYPELRQRFDRNGLQAEQLPPPPDERQGDRHAPPPFEDEAPPPPPRDDAPPPHR